MLDIAGILTELCSLPGPSGFERPVAERVKALLEPFVDEAWIDVLGNVIAVRRCGREGAPKLLFDAHIDENGLIVTGVEEGFLRFAALGGVDNRILPACLVSVLTDPPRSGVVCVMPPHILKKEDTEKVIKIEDMYLDVGLAHDEAIKAIPPGTPCVLDYGARLFGQNCLCGKALDDRAGFVSILWALELLRDEKLTVDLYVTASVQEEVGARGAASGVFPIEPDRCVVIDVGFAKTPDTKPYETNDELGGGVTISRGPNMNVEFTESAIHLAVNNEIKHQIKVEPGGNSGTNARVIQISREGVATALFGLPLKYMHGIYEVVSLEDIGNAARLLCEVAKGGPQ